MINEYVKFIKTLREEKGISQAEIAKKIGISRTSYIAFEQNKRDISLGEIEKLSKELSFSFEELEQKEMPNYEKYRQMILAFLRKNKNVTKTKLAKLLYFADFGWFYSHLKSMSGMQYRKISYGPVADTYFRMIDEMAEKGEIGIEYKSEGAMIISQTRSGSKIALSSISKEEDSLMDKISEKWQGKKTSEIVDFTHKQFPYLYAKENEIVSYGLFTQEDPDEIF